MLNLIIKASSRYPIHRRKIREVIEKTLGNRGVVGDTEVEINIVGDRKMTQLHVQYMEEEGTTDVLSFPLHEGYLTSKDQSTGFIDYPDQVLRLGTIVISYPQAQRQANIHKLLIDDEINRLVEHGMLHLLGIHHE